jgi:uncharacterized protein
MKPVHTIVFAKSPIAGLAKTRLIPALGTQGSARLAQRMLHHTLHTALTAQLGQVELCAAPSPADPVWHTFNLPTTISWSDQGGGDLGQRMARAAQRVLDAGQNALLIGTDCPSITSELLQNCAQDLSTHDATLVPTADGGYCLLGLRRFDPALFDHIPWSTDAVSRITQQRLKELNWRFTVHPSLHDIDDPADIAHLPPSWGYACDNLP